MQRPFKSINHRQTIYPQKATAHNLTLASQVLCCITLNYLLYLVLVSGCVYFRLQERVQSKFIPWEDKQKMYFFQEKFQALPIRKTINVY